mmetsp:Transcript_27637/g.65085  ORF Transcript_27637/g.65085 Transcript_27637/m.65085 type:complete len:617 (+) Transcript_27637:64-1914(+)
MAAAVEMQMLPDRQSPASSQSRSPANIRFSDVASYVSLSLVRDPTQVRGTPKRHQSVPALGGRSPSAAPTPKSELPPAEPPRVASLPTIQANRADRLRCQLEWLKAEQRAEKEQLHRLESALSDSMLLEKKAQKRVAKKRDMRDFHNQRVQDVEDKIGKLRGELEAQNAAAKAPRPSPRSLALEKKNRPSPRQNAAKREVSTPDPVETPAELPETVLPPLEAAVQAEVEDSYQGKSSPERRESPVSRQTSTADPGTPAKSRATLTHAGAEVEHAPRRRKTAKTLDVSDLTQAPEEVQYSDEDCEGAIDLKHRSGPNTPVVARPAVGGSWVKQYLKNENMSGTRCAKWQPSNNDEKIGILLQAAQLRSEGDTKKKWMSSTFRRLKTRGKSDARCREVVALHLPRGSGPKDREDVPIFSQNEVRACKKSYTDSYMDPVKRIQKVIVDMKDQKRELRAVREDLFMVTEARLLQQRVEEDRKNVAASIGGLLGKVKDPLKDEDTKPAEAAPAALVAQTKPPPKSFKKLAEENGMEEEAISDLFREYLKFADSSEMLGRKAFTRLLQALCPTRTLVDSDLDAWWGQITRSSQDSKSSNNRRTQCKFEEFVVWFSTSEARSQ